MNISLKDALFIGFCAGFILTAKALLRLHLKIPGHSMFFTICFLLVARGCVRHWLSASFCGLLAGIMAVILGMGKGGPLILIKFLLPSVTIDLMAVTLPGMFQSVALCVVSGGLAASTRMLSTCVIDIMAGMEPGIVMQHVWLQGAGNVLFGMAGAVGVPAVIRKLIAYGAIHDAPRDMHPQYDLDLGVDGDKCNSSQHSMKTTENKENTP